MSCENSKDKGKRKRAPASDPSKKTKTRNPETHQNDVVVKSEPIVVNASDRETVINTAADVLSFHGENGEVYTLAGPPKEPELILVGTPQVDAPSVVTVKKGLIQFMMEAGPNDVDRIITQANNIFAFLQAMNADYGSFYDSIRAYICCCLEWYAAENELKKCKALQKLISHYDQLLHHSNEMKKDVPVLLDDIEKAKARVGNTKEKMENLWLELEERKKDLRNLEAAKMDKIKEIAAVDVNLKASASSAEKARRLIRENTDRRVKARLSMDNARNQLKGYLK